MQTHYELIETVCIKAQFFSLIKDDFVYFIIWVLIFTMPDTGVSPEPLIMFALRLTGKQVRTEVSIPAFFKECRLLKAHIGIMPVYLIVNKKAGTKKDNCSQGVF